MCHLQNCKRTANKNVSANLYSCLPVRYVRNSVLTIPVNTKFANLYKYTLFDGAEQFRYNDGDLLTD
jgi:hypothetical protein